MLADFQPPALDESTRATLEDFVADKKDSMDDAWY
jgi:trimethylamine:corrinoid methyltransferase-like protein